MWAYIEKVQQLISQAARTQGEAMEEAARRIADCIAAGGVIHVFGTGHSHMPSEEIFYRAGGLACVNPIIDEAFMLHHGAEKSTAAERLPGIARIVLDREDVRPGEVLIIFSNSGVNAVPVEMAHEAIARGLQVIAFTSLTYAAQTEPKNPLGKRLHEMAHVVIDNQGVRGDSVISLPGLDATVGGTSTVVGLTLLNAIMVRASERLLEMGITPPVFISSNMPGASENKAKPPRKYRGPVGGLCGPQLVGRASPPSCSFC